MIKTDKHRTESAVSPVIGILLMLIVTVIIAAIVSGFAGGLAGNTEAAPQAAISCQISNSTDGMGMTSTRVEFKLMSGDPVPTKNLAILMYYTNNTGYTWKHEQTASSKLIDPYAAIPSYAGKYTQRPPCRNNLATGWAYEPQQHFGNFTWMVGDKMTAGTNLATAALLNMTEDEVGNELKPGSIVDVKIKHLPSSKFIFDKEVTVL